MPSPSKGEGGRNKPKDCDMAVKKISEALYPAAREMRVAGGDVRVERLAVELPEGGSPEERFPAELFRRWVEDEFLVTIPIAPGRASSRPTRGPDYTSSPLASGAASGAKRIIIGSVETLRRRMPRVKLPVDVPRHAEGYAVSAGPEGVYAVGRDYRGTL